MMLKDALTTSHPVSTPISTPDDIAQSFDTISYSKVIILAIHVFSNMYSLRVMVFNATCNNISVIL